MNFDLIFQSRKVFSEISSLYVLFEEHPYTGLHILASNPYTKKRITESRTPEDIEWQIWEAGPMDDDDIIPPSYEFEHYRFCYNDVSDYLCKRTYDIQTSLFEGIQAISKSEVEDRIEFYTVYQKELESFRDRLLLLEKIPDDELKNTLNPIIPRLKGRSDWQGIYNALQCRVPEMRITAAAYARIISRYLSALTTDLVIKQIHNQEYIPNQPTRESYILSDDFLDEVSALLHKCYCDICDITKDWGTYNLSSLPQDLWDASESTFKALSNNLCLNAYQLSVLTGPAHVEQKINSMMYRAAGNAEQKAYLLKSLRILFHSAQGCYEKVNLYTCGGSQAPKVDEFFSNACQNIVYSATCLTLYLEPILFSIKKHEESSPQKACAEEITKTVDKFEALFFDPQDIDRCVAALREYNNEKPLLSAGLDWIGGKKRKGLIVAWIEAMEGLKKPILRRMANRKYLVVLLNNYFPGLHMGLEARVFDEPANPKVKQAFIALLSS